MEKTKLPHLGQITINAIVYKQLPEGSFHPEAVWHDAFSINLVSDSAEDCIKEILSKIEAFKNDENRSVSPA